MKRRIVAGFISLFLVGGGVYLLNSEDSFKSKQTSSLAGAKSNFSFFNNKGLSLKNWLISLHILKGDKPVSPANKVEKTPVPPDQKTTAPATSPELIMTGSSSHTMALATSTAVSSSGSTTNSTSSGKNGTTSNNQSSHATNQISNNNVKPTPSVVSKNPNPPVPSTGKDKHVIHQGKVDSPIIGIMKGDGPLKGVPPLLYKGLHLPVSALPVIAKIK